MEVGTQNAANGVKSNPQTETKKENAQFNLFLKLMTAQAKNQDPMNPSDPTDFASQLATFTQVEQQIKANTLLEKWTEMRCWARRV
jgi:flagellar basal-body rod modification protein FlgD